ncbi:hypothetical protein B9Z55_027992 [Caenorhabditis nigoni]|uniref:Uncharacterized protein n=1 Tax=Caenorhabditis nigoni TaxID=1611254 RepID=A0A2G5SDH2_9PELO|nr:hypothetical protein B9Z55_027992 [Caenorhabditis nigoni]
MVLNETSRTFCGRYRLRVEGVLSTVISRSPNNFWIVMEEEQERKKLRLYNVQMLGLGHLKPTHLVYNIPLNGAPKRYGTFSMVPRPV